MDPGWRSELQEIISIPSVSADPERRADVRRAAEWVRDYIADGGGDAELRDVAGNELVVGEFRASRGADSAPAVLCYGHFDVQPAAPLDRWESDPFELTVRGDWAYARGVTDDKGQLWILLRAARELAAAGTLPVNLRFVCDGEEETGGQTVAEYLALDGDELHAAIIFDSGMRRVDVPVFDLGTRGLLGFRVKVRTGTHDLHSGQYGGAAANAVHVLADCLGALLAGPDGRLPAPLRAGVQPPAPDELAAWTRLSPGADELAAHDAVPLDPHAADEFYVRTWAEPSADVNGILGGKPGLSNTSIPFAAAGEITIRLAPGQDVAGIAAAGERLMRAAAPTGTALDIDWDGTPPALTDPDATAIRLGLDAFERALGVRPLLGRSGGTLPVMPALARRGIPTILTGFALPDSNVHAANERFLVRYFDAGLRAGTALYTGLADLRG